MANHYTQSKLNSLREQIEQMSKNNQIDVLRILYDNQKMVLNENQYGVHVNLSELSDEILNKLDSYLDYVNNQETYLNQAEQEKKQYISTFFTNEENNIKE